MSVSSAGHGDYTWKVDDARADQNRRGGGWEAEAEAEVVDGGGRGGRIVGKRKPDAVFSLSHVPLS